ncbi:uncharacterized protein LACBIDRAFT_323265 [Laccaria bicolor S238N-H82]|uniref:Predicted protein n=1 Tax=Laccaria bicolor (strain S238N-H82 / ATCC MYA-4686) TaxID=486041 RepID=B0CZN5_LACBS|nr:uncharacterized protein LACBIDRAFT_323265 [Laccaria bicolor S238N-H82]EDR12651.1 predicted protein [Laccaria bicolor S238N-H82]|eukprot:XP_001876915.1 predicted protein [Laccaria bicolor S238N-H82]
MRSRRGTGFPSACPQPVAVSQCSNITPLIIDVTLPLLLSTIQVIQNSPSHCGFAVCLGFARKTSPNGSNKRQTHRIDQTKAQQKRESRRAGNKRTWWRNTG